MRVRSPATRSCRCSWMARSLHRRDTHQTPADIHKTGSQAQAKWNAPTLIKTPTANLAPRGRWFTHRAESARRPHHARGLDDGVDAAVQLHLSVHAAHRAFLGGDDGHLHLAVVDERVEDGLDVVHGKVHLPVGHTEGT